MFLATKSCSTLIRPKSNTNIKPRINRIEMRTCISHPATVCSKTSFPITSKPWCVREVARSLYVSRRSVFWNVKKLGEAAQSVLTALAQLGLFLRSTSAGAAKINQRPRRGWRSSSRCWELAFRSDRPASADALGRDCPARGFGVRERIPAQQAHQMLAGASEGAVGAMNEHWIESIARTTGVLHLAQFSGAQFAFHEVCGHPAKTNPHGESSFLGGKVRQIKHAFAAEHVPIVALIAGVLHRQLHVFMQLIEGDRGFARQWVGRSHAQYTQNLGKRFRQQLRTRLVVLDEHQIRVVSFEAILHALEKFHL